MQCLVSRLSHRLISILPFSNLNTHIASTQTHNTMQFYDISAAFLTCFVVSSSSTCSCCIISLLSSIDVLISDLANHIATDKFCRFCSIAYWSGFLAMRCSNSVMCSRKRVISSCSSCSSSQTVTASAAASTLSLSAASHFAACSETNSSRV